MSLHLLVLPFVGLIQREVGVRNAGNVVQEFRLVLLAHVKIRLHASLLLQYNLYNVNGSIISRFQHARNTPAPLVPLPESSVTSFDGQAQTLLHRAVPSFNIITLNQHCAKSFVFTATNFIAHL